MVDTLAIRPDRIPTRLRARITSGITSYPVTVLSLSGAGFYCEGIALEDVPAVFRLRLPLDPAEPTWSPKSTASPTSGGSAASGTPATLDADAELLYLDLGRERRFGAATTGLGGRFALLADPAREALEAFISMQLRRREGRTRGGSVPLAAAMRPRMV